MKRFVQYLYTSMWKLSTLFVILLKIFAWKQDKRDETENIMFNCSSTNHNDFPSMTSKLQQGKRYVPNIVSIV